MGERKYEIRESSSSCSCVRVSAGVLCAYAAITSVFIVVVVVVAQEYIKSHLFHTPSGSGDNTQLVVGAGSLRNSQGVFDCRPAELGLT